MKKLNNIAYLLASLLVVSNTIHADLHNEILLDSSLNKMNTAMDSYEKNKAKDKDLELEARLLIDSHEVILDYVKNKKYVALKTAYDKMKDDKAFARPNNEQIAEYRTIIQDHIQTTKIEIKNKKQSNAYLKQCIKNGIALGSVIIVSGGLFAWGSWKIHMLPGRQKSLPERYMSTAAKLAIDYSAIIGLPLTSFLFLKLLIQLVSSDEIEMLQKMNGLLLLFEQLNDVHSQA